MRISLLIFAALTISGCSVNEGMDSGTNIGDDLRAQLTIELEKADIPYKVDDDGFLRYNEKYQTIVEALTIRLLEQQERKKERKYGFKFAKDINPTAFFAYLHHNGISTENLVLHVEDNAIYWKEENDSKMQEHLFAFLDEYRDWQSKQENENAL
jgi:hypothetical protein